MHSTPLLVCLFPCAAPHARLVQDVSVPSRGPHSIPIRLYTPHDSSRRGRDGAWPLLIWVHGGGWSIGSIDSDDKIVRNLVQVRGGGALSSSTLAFWRVKVAGCER